MEKELDIVIQEAEELTNKLEQEVFELDNRKLAPAAATIFVTKEELLLEYRGRIKGDSSIMNIVNPLSKNVKNYKNEVKTKQDKIDNNLTTTEKTIVGSINELRTTNDTQESNIKLNTDNINAIKSDYLKATDANKKFDEKQNKNDDTLKTTDKTVSGAINEIKKTTDNQTTTINQNITDIQEIKSDYLKTSDANNALALKQNIIDNKLTTTEKTIVGSINELKTTNDTQESNIKLNTDNINAIKSDYLKATDANKKFDEKQNKNDDTLKTTDKTVSGAINEIQKTTDNQTNNISEIKKDYLKISDADEKFDEKQNKSDNNLITKDKTIIGSINELKTTNDNQTTNINQNITDIQEIKSDYLKTSDANNALALKQNIIDNKLTTTEKTIVGSINELKQNNDTQANNISEIKKNYLKISDANEKFDEKQNITDEDLITNNKTVVGAINEININKTNNDEFILLRETLETYQEVTNDTLDNKQDKFDNSLTTNNKTIVKAINEINAKNGNQNEKIVQNENEISEIKKNYLKISNANEQFDTKQNITDKNLATIDKTVSGAINELKLTTDAQTTNINEIQKDYLKRSDMNNVVDSKQDKADKNLETTDKNIVGAINELNSAKKTQEKNIKENINDIKYIKETYLQTADIDNKQNKIDNSLNTNKKTIVGAINELNTNLASGKVVGTSKDARIWQYILKTNKKYRVVFHWNSWTDNTSKIYKEFTWTGRDISLETYVTGYRGIDIFGYQVLGGLEVVELSATATGIKITNKMGSPKNGRIIELEELS